MEKEIHNTMLAKNEKKKELEVGKKLGEMTLQLSSIRHGRDKQKTCVLEKNMGRTTLNIGWT